MTPIFKEVIEKMKKDFIHLDLAFAGGGAKGIVHIGALQELRAQGYTFRKLVGTSAGAITSTLLAVGYSPDEILDAITEKMPDGTPRMGTFMDTPDKEELESLIIGEKHRKEGSGKSSILGEKLTRSLLVSESYRQLVSFVYFGGFFKGDAFLEWIQNKLDWDGTQLGHATFAEFHEQTGKDLTIVATDTTTKILLALNHRSSPDVPVSWGVRMSMSIPFFWQEVVWQKEWGKYLGDDINGHVIVDGGVISNFPLGLLLSKDPNIREVMGRSSNPGRVIGLLIDTTLPVPGSEETTAKKSSLEYFKPSDKNWQMVIDRFTNLSDTMLRGHDNLVRLAYPDRVCRLPAQGYDTMEFDMSDERVELLLKAGRKAMADFLSTKRV